MQVHYRLLGLVLQNILVLFLYAETVLASYANSKEHFLESSSNPVLAEQGTGQYNYANCPEANANITNTAHLHNAGFDATNDDWRRMESNINYNLARTDIKTERTLYNMFTTTYQTDFRAFSNQKETASHSLPYETLTEESSSLSQSSSSTETSLSEEERNAYIKKLIVSMTQATEPKREFTYAYIYLYTQTLHNIKNIRLDSNDTQPFHDLYNESQLIDLKDKTAGFVVNFSTTDDPNLANSNHGGFAHSYILPENPNNPSKYTQIYTNLAAYYAYVLKLSSAAYIFDTVEFCFFASEIESVTDYIENEYSVDIFDFINVWACTRMRKLKENIVSIAHACQLINFEPAWWTVLYSATYIRNDHRLRKIISLAGYVRIEICFLIVEYSTLCAPNFYKFLTHCNVVIKHLVILVPARENDFDDSGYDNLMRSLEVRKSLLPNGATMEISIIFECFYCKYLWRSFVDAMKIAKWSRKKGVPLKFWIKDFEVKHFPREKTTQLDPMKLSKLISDSTLFYSSIETIPQEKFLELHVGHEIGTSRLKLQIFTELDQFLHEDRVRVLLNNDGVLTKMI